jgi:lysine/ornithine N-monooxygenase
VEPVNGIGHVERRSGSGWHRSMLLEDATMQIAFLKDLVTLRNPAAGSASCPICHDRDRLVDFIHHGSMFPTRLEFHDYLEWVAARIRPQVDCGNEVCTIRPVAGARAQGPCSRVTTTAPPTTARSPTGCSTRARWTTSSGPPRRSRR